MKKLIDVLMVLWALTFYFVIPGYAQDQYLGESIANGSDLSPATGTDLLPATGTDLPEDDPNPSIIASGETEEMSWSLNSNGLLSISGSRMGDIWTMGDTGSYSYWEEYTAQIRQAQIAEGMENIS